MAVVDEFFKSKENDFFAEVIRQLENGILNVFIELEGHYVEL